MSDPEACTVSGSLGFTGLAATAPEVARHGPVECGVGGRVEVLRPGRRPASAAEIAAAFAERGERVLDDLRGRFCLYLWHPAERRGLIAVDQLGAGSLFYAAGVGGRLCFAHEVRHLLAGLERCPPPFAPALARWLARGVLEPGETLYEGVRRLTGGRFLRLEGETWSERRYWAPRFVGTLGVDRVEAVRLVRAGVTGAIERRVAGAGRVGVMLSGGLDSGSVAALAGTLVPDGPRAYSATFPGQPAADESVLVAETAEALGLASRTFPAPACGVMDAAARHVRDWRLPPGSPNLYFQLPALRAAAADGVTHVLDGQGGDELFGCVPALLADELRRLHLLGAWRLAHALAGGGRRAAARALRAYGLRSAAPTPAGGLLRPELEGALEAGSRTERRGPRWWNALADQLTAGRERFGAHDHLRRKFASAGLVGLHPYLDDLDLVELMLRLPPGLSFDETFDRPLLREAVRGVLPDTVRLRRGKSFFDRPLVAALDGADRPALDRLLGGGAEIRAYVRPEAITAALAPAPVGRGSSAWAWRVWRLASTEQWLATL